MKLRQMLNRPDRRRPTSRVSRNLGNFGSDALWRAAIATIGLSSVCWAGGALADEATPADDPSVVAGSSTSGQTEAAANAAAAAAAAAPFNVFPPGSLSASLGASAWSGDFGSRSTTTISAALLTGVYKWEDLRLSATLPYSRIDTRGDIFLGLGATPLIVRPENNPSRHVGDGLGDITFNASYVLHPLPSAGVDVELLGAVKAPTASAGSRLSTGRTDFSFGAEVLKTAGRFAPFASFVYRDFGSTSQFRLRDGAATSIGVSYLVTSRWIADISYDYARSASHYVSDSHEIVSSASYKLERFALRLSAYASAGLSSGAPAVSGGLSIGKTF